MEAEWEIYYVLQKFGPYTFRLRKVVVEVGDLDGLEVLRTMVVVWTKISLEVPKMPLVAEIRIFT